VGDSAANTVAGLFPGCREAICLPRFGEWIIARAELLIEQISNFLRRARPLDLVQGSSHLLVEPGIRIQRLSHLSFSRPKANLIRPDQVAGFPTPPIIKRMQGLRGTSGNQLDD
jgi:hypothetical protein